MFSAILESLKIATAYVETLIMGTRTLRLKAACNNCRYVTAQINQQAHGRRMIRDMGPLE